MIDTPSSHLFILSTHHHSFIPPLLTSITLHFSFLFLLSNPPSESVCVYITVPTVSVRSLSVFLSLYYRLLECSQLTLFCSYGCWMCLFFQHTTIWLLRTRSHDGLTRMHWQRAPAIHVHAKTAAAIHAKIRRTRTNSLQPTFPHQIKPEHRRDTRHKQLCKEATHTYQWHITNKHGRT